MEVRVDVRLNGLEEKLEQLGPKLAKSTLRKALVAASKIWETEAKAKVPVDTGSLRDDIKTKVTMNAKQDKGTASVSPMYDPSLAKNGKDSSQDPGIYGMFVEFGLKNRQMPAQPYLRPAYDSKAEAVLDKFVEVMADGLEQAVK